MKRIKVDIEEKVVQALDILAEELQPETRVESLKCNDLIIVMINWCRHEIKKVNSWL